MSNVVNIVEGTYGLQGTVSGTDQTVLALTNTVEHTAPNILRVWVENPGGGVSTAVTSLNTVTGTTTMVGVDGVTVLTDVPNRILTVSGFQTEFVNASGSLQDQLDNIDFPDTSNALEGSDGITVTSGSNIDTISGFYSEFVAASGALSSEIDNDIAAHAAITDAHHVRYGKNENDALTGSDGITIVSGSNTIDVGGFYAEFTSASGSLQSDIDINTTAISDNTTLITTTSGHLQAQIDGIDVDEVEPAIVGSDGITVTSGTYTTTVSAFYAEFTSASGSLQTQIDAVEGSDVDSVNAITGAVLVTGTQNVTTQTAGQSITITGPDLSSYATSAEVATVSGHLSDEIDSDIATHTANVSAHHVRYSKNENDAITGSDGITVSSGSNTIDVEGFYSEFTVASGTLQSDIDTNTAAISSNTALITTTSGHLQTQIDGIDVDEVEPALIGTDGITVTSGSSTTTVSAFYTEFTNASGTLSNEIDSDITAHAAISDAHHGRWTKAENDAITGSDGITVTSGSNAIDIGGFYAEFTNASGTLNDTIDSDITTHAADDDAHHAKYTDAEAISALEPTTSALAASGVATDAEVDTKVAKAGDTMTGNLQIDDANLVVGGTVSGTDFYVADLVASGTISSDGGLIYPRLTYVDAPTDILSANKNNYDLSSSSLWRLNAAGADWTITGIAAPSGPRAGLCDEVTIMSVGNFAVILGDQVAGSTATNRIITGTGENLYLYTNHSARLVYDNTTTKWRVVSHHVGEGTTNHSLLDNLDYASAGHTGFATDTEVDTKVSKSGDTMTGDLWIDGANLTISGTTSGINFLMGDAAVSGMLTMGENHNYPTGEGRFILIPSTAVQKGQGGSINIQAGFWNESVSQIDSAQLLSQAATFVDNGRLQETGAITSAHTLFNKTGFASNPGYRLAHDGTSTAAVPLLAGFMASPAVGRESGYTGNATVSQMCGFVTNALNPLLAFLQGQQINAGFTVNKYAHFEANSDVSGQGLVNNGGTLLEEVGLDLQNINVGNTKISVRSTATGASMRHAGPVTIGENRPPQAGLGLDVEGDTSINGDLSISGTSGDLATEGQFITGEPTITAVDLNGTDYTGQFTVINESQEYDVIFAKYSSGWPGNYILARAKGSQASPGALSTDDAIGQFNFFGHDGTQFEQGATLSVKVWDTVATNDLPAGFRFSVRPKGQLSPQQAVDFKCNQYLILGSRWGTNSTNVLTTSLSADQDDYDPENVAGGNSARLLWRLTANSTARTITGILAPTFPSLTDNIFLYIINVGATYNIVLANQNASSTDVNRIITGTGADLTLTPDQTAALLYDNITDRWRVVSRNF